MGRSINSTVRQYPLVPGAIFHRGHEENTTSPMYVTRTGIRSRSSIKASDGTSHRPGTYGTARWLSVLGARCSRRGTASLGRRRSSIGGIFSPIPLELTSLIGPYRPFETHFRSLLSAYRASTSRAALTAAQRQDQTVLSVWLSASLGGSL
jgi:hypothetical protein